MKHHNEIVMVNRVMTSKLTFGTALQTVFFLPFSSQWRIQFRVSMSTIYELLKNTSFLYVHFQIENGAIFFHCFPYQRHVVAQDELEATAVLKPFGSNHRVPPPSHISVFLSGAHCSAWCYVDFSINVLENWRHMVDRRSSKTIRQYILFWN